MDKNNYLYKYHKDNKISFVSKHAFNNRYLYFPLCGIDTKSIKSSITPFLSGDIKTDKFNYLTRPASREDLKNDLRNFFIKIEGKGILSLTGRVEDDDSFIEAGQLWHKLNKRFNKEGVEIESLNFVPVSGENIELMQVTVKNISDETLKMRCVFSAPIFARSLSNKHDHEHVTSLLNRIKQVENGVIVKPAMKFDENGHNLNENIFYVLGATEDGVGPAGTFPTVESFIGDSGTLSRPNAVFNDIPARRLSEDELQGKEAMGALLFDGVELKPKANKKFIIVLGVNEKTEDVDKTFKKFDSSEKVAEALAANKDYWTEKTQSITFNVNDEDFNSWMKWVTLQPILRRIYGCSFLPDHDYGKGGKGWRDIWQDLLSLILIEPENIREVLINNFAGVRIDGSNATIIGSRPGEFIADRNAISRVWMDHGVWPFLTLQLYINQTGDFDIFLKEGSYFHDYQMSRSFEKAGRGMAEYGNKLLDKKGAVCHGSILEHILIQHLVQFFNVGEHNITRLENADWNDGLDMAFEIGESVTFMSFYAGNMFSIAGLLEELAVRKGIKETELAKEVTILLDSLSEKIDYGNIEAKKDLLFNKYFSAVQPEISGEKVSIAIKDIADDLRKKGQWMFEHIRKQEKISVKDQGNVFSWFNGYYDNKGKRVEGKIYGNIRMTLTGQVFPIMSGLAEKQDIIEITKSVKQFLQDKDLKGIRLNTDFKVDHYLDLGRAFGFSYGTKENGAFFSHMVVMYAYALYKQGFVRQGHEVLNSIYKMSIDTEKSKIYPGVPEYFDSKGRGMYHYLTGAASWFVLTQLTEVFGVSGEKGDLSFDPKLVKEEFKSDGNATVKCKFAGKILSITFKNPQKLDYDKYYIKELRINNFKVNVERNKAGKVFINRNSLVGYKSHINIEIQLS